LVENGNAWLIVFLLILGGEILREKKNAGEKGGRLIPLIWELEIHAFWVG
jgi:hypothetical protein